jgi:hypothetical protein
MRRLIVTAACLISVLSFGIVGVSTAGASSLPTEGIYENCSLDASMQTCIDRLQVMHQGGFQVVVEPATGESLSSLSTYAAAAHQLGMSVMWAIGQTFWWQDPMTSNGMDWAFPAESTACGCTQDGQLLAYLIQFLGGLPGTYGYYAADDTMLGPGDLAGVSDYVARIKQQDPTHTVLIGSSGENETSAYARLGDLVGQEIYPVTTSSLMPVSSSQGIWGEVGQLASDTQQTANQAGKQSAFILQAFTWGDNLDDGQGIGVCGPNATQLSCYNQLRYPSGAEQLQLRNEVLRHAHPKLILWWSFQGTYGQSGTDTYSIYPTGSVAAARWAGLTAAINAPAPGSPVAHRAPKARIALLPRRTNSTRHRTGVRFGGGSSRFGGLSGSVRAVI